MGKKKLAVIDDSVKEEKVEKPKKEKVLAINKETPKKEKVLGINKEKQAEKPVIASEAKQSSSDIPQTEIATSPAAPRNDKTTPKQGQPKPRSKKYKEAIEKVERNKNYSIDEAISLVKETSYTKFPGTLEIHINTAIKGVRGLVALPFASGKKIRICAFGKGAEESGADLVGDEEKLKNIEKGKIDFDVLVTTPEWMPRLARMAKVLGPRGLMPNPKNGTVTSDLKKTVTELQSGKAEYKTEKVGKVIHLSLGKLSQPDEELVQNVKTLLGAIGKTKIKQATLSPTMGPGVKVDLGGI